MTQIEIPKKRRDEIKQTVIKALSNGNSYLLPIKIKAIVRSFSNIRLISFSKHMRKFNLSYGQMIALEESKDACTDYYADSDIYLIYYNDIDQNIVKSNRYRWNIAHELGHVLLLHHINNLKTRIFRSSLSDGEYDMLETEADYFAQLILVPHATLIGFKVESYRNISIMCEVSNPAAKKRFYEYSKWTKHINPNDDYDKRIFHLFYPFIFKKECQNCGASLIQRYGKFCPICGNKSLKWGDGNMIYPKIATNEIGKPMRCPICDSEETSVKGNYCQICGTYLLNECSNEECGATLPTNARYCPICGSKSLFSCNNILKEWNFSAVQDGFLNIPDEPEFPYGVEEEGLPFN